MTSPADRFEARTDPGLQQDPRSLPQLLGDLARDISMLFQKETQLIRSELSDKIGQVEAGAGSLAAGAICLLVALLVLVQALVIALSEIMGAGWASLLVGVVIAVIGAVLLKKGAGQLKPSNLTPDRTASQFRKDADLVREQVR